MRSGSLGDYQRGIIGSMDSNRWLCNQLAGPMKSTILNRFVPLINFTFETKERNKDDKGVNMVLLLLF